MTKVKKAASPKTSTASTVAASKPAAKKSTTKKKAVAKKPAAKKSAAPKPPAVKVPVAKKAARKKVIQDPHGLYMAPEVYKSAIDSLMDQGLDHKDAVVTLKIGMRQANGRPVPMELLMETATT